VVPVGRVALGVWAASAVPVGLAVQAASPAPVVRVAWAALVGQAVPVVPEGRPSGKLAEASAPHPVRNNVQAGRSEI
jgi:hypothetical protein